MITRPVAIARALIVTAAVWAVGAGIVVGLFSAFHASKTIDLSGEHQRVQILWLGANAFVVCVAALLGVCLGGSALSHAGVDSPGRASVMVTTPTVTVAALAAVAIASVGWFEATTLLAVLVGLGIGAAAGMYFVVQNGVAEGDIGFGRQTNRRAGRSWSSR